MFTHPTPVLPEYQELLQSIRPSCENKLLQLVYEDEKNSAELVEMIPVEVTSRNFPKLEIPHRYCTILATKERKQGESGKWMFESRSGVACFRAGDVIGCTIDQDELVPYLRFYLNGAQVLPPLQASQPTQSRSPAIGHSTTSSSPGIACQNPVYCLFPVVSMYSSRKKPQMRVRFNFQGAFRFPIPGFEPYGAPL
ncbi:hypothetical protein P43SY_009154 [Pythium insidiosum]|uniref:SPRY domain-containing protein n=1 Tax=Pythium insidiosum TaxID=114742 RepID=A0AAD5LJ55_PYTIN|nr:hypothetical protein P43SY_009154 [Pythium insidiosum]